MNSIASVPHSMLRRWSGKSRSAPSAGAGFGAAALCALLLLGAFPARALEPIDTDGPDFVESSESVPKGHFQYEVDATAVDDRRPASQGTMLSTPTLLKYGMTDTLELRIAPEGYERQDGVSGVGETALGLKWHPQDAAQGTPSVSWLLHIDAPSGASEFKGNGIRPSLRTVYTWDLPYDLALGVMPGIKYDTTADSHRYVSGIFGAVLNKHFSERFRAFVEFAAPQIAPGRDGGVLAGWDIGTAYMITNDFQLGARAGVAANRNTPSSYVLFEVAQRF